MIEMYTEKEAKSKWCPMAMAADHHSPKDTVCVGAICMMWRWDDFQFNVEEENLDRRGHCGLGGKP